MPDKPIKYTDWYFIEMYTHCTLLDGKINDIDATRQYLLSPPAPLLGSFEGSPTTPAGCATPTSGLSGLKCKGSSGFLLLQPTASVTFPF